MTFLSAKPFALVLEPWAHAFPWVPQAEPLLSIVSAAGPRHVAARFLQAAHAELPQSEFGFQPQVANAPLRKDGRDRPRKTSTFNFYVANLACKTILY